MRGGNTMKFIPKVRRAVAAGWQRKAGRKRENLKRSPKNAGASQYSRNFSVTST